jgi:hypothetical protein
MRVVFLVEIELSHAEGKFAGRDEIVEVLQGNLDEADPQQVDCGEGGQYYVDSWTVTEQVEPKRVRRKKA